MTAARSSLPETQNPVLALPAVQLFHSLPAEARHALLTLLDDLAAQASEKGNKCWTQRKYSMAAYWKCVSVYTKHIAAAIRRQARRKEAANG